MRTTYSESVRGELLRLATTPMNYLSPQDEKRISELLELVNQEEYNPGSDIGFTQKGDSQNRKTCAFMRPGENRIYLTRSISWKLIEVDPIFDKYGYGFPFLFSVLEHETIHQILYHFEGVGTCLSLDNLERIALAELIKTDKK